MLFIFCYYSNSFNLFTNNFLADYLRIKLTIYPPTDSTHSSSVKKPRKPTSRSRYLARDYGWKICKTSKGWGHEGRRGVQEKINRDATVCRHEDEWRGEGRAERGLREEEERKGIAGSLVWVEGHSCVAVPCLLRWPRHLTAKHTCPTPRSNSLTTIPDLVPLSCKPRGGIVASFLGYSHIVVRQFKFSVSFFLSFFSIFSKLGILGWSRLWEHRTYKFSISFENFCLEIVLNIEENSV